VFNRRDFIKLTSILAASLPLAGCQLENDMPLFDEILLKVARNETLTPGELDHFGQDARRLGEIKNLVDGWLTNKIPAGLLDLPVEEIYSQVLAEDKLTVFVPIPTDYKHLIVWGSGRNDNAGTNSDYLVHTYNGDTGNNYIDQKFFVVDTAISGARDTAQPNGMSGLLAQDGRPAGDVCSWVTFIPHYTSPSLNKNSVTLSILPYGSLFLFSSSWDSLDPIESIEYACNTGSEKIKAGSVFSIFGWK
jgi:hypothetical protein